MASIDIKDAAGKKVGSAQVADAVFGIQPNTHAVHLVVRSQMAARRAGTHDTKTRGDWQHRGVGTAIVRLAVE